MRSFLIWPLGAFLLITGLFMPAQAATRSMSVICNSTKYVVGHLLQKYGERPVAFGVIHKDSLAQLFINREKATWSLVLSLSHGESCLMASGTDWITSGAHSRTRQAKP